MAEKELDNFAKNIEDEMAQTSQRLKAASIRKVEKNLERALQRNKS